MDGRTVVVRHEKIPGYMEAMTMPFEVREPKELAGVGAGDKVMFRMRVTEKEGWIDRVQVLAKSKLDAVPPDPTFRQVRDVDPLKVGDLMPDYHFTNEMGHAVGLSDYRGRAFAFTFIFTRCPFPNFCPRMTSNFADVVKLMPRAGGVTNWHLFSISFDPEYDTPNRLKVYGERNGPAYDPRHWSFLTGALTEIDGLTEQFGMYFSREAGTVNFNHNLRTVVVGADGRIKDVFIGNEWKPEELVTALMRAAGAGR